MYFIIGFNIWCCYRAFLRRDSGFFCFCIKMGNSCQKRLFCSIYYGQNKFFISFFEKCHIFAFLAGYYLRGHLFFCSKMSLFQFFNRGYIWEFFWIFGPFGAFSLPTNWGDKYFFENYGTFRAFSLPTT